MAQENPTRFWYGRDLVTAEDVEVNGVASVPVWPLHGSLPRSGSIENLSVATRSRFAQWGLEVLQNAVEPIARYEEDRRVKPPRVKVKNHARALSIPAGTPIFGLYSQGPRIEGEELAQLMGTDIKIEGRWKFVRRNRYTKKAIDITAIAVEIRNDRRWHIPNDSALLNVEALSQAGADYRDVLGKEYESVPRNSPVDIWFGELPEVELSMGVAVEIAKPIAPRINEAAADIEEMERQRIYPHGRHIGARLLHPGSGLNNPNGWPIRVEIDTRGSVQKPGAVIFRVMRAT